MTIVGTITQKVTATGTTGAAADAKWVGLDLPRPRMAIADESGARVMVPYAPEKSRLGNLARRWVQLERPGAKPLLEQSGEQLPTVDLELAVGYPDHRSVEDILSALRRLAESTKKVQVTGWHGLAEGWWRITECSIETTRLTAANEVSDASVTLQFTQASDTDVRAGTFTTIPKGSLTLGVPLGSGVASNVAAGLASPFTPASAKPVVAAAAKERAATGFFTKPWNKVAVAVNIDDVRSGGGGGGSW